VSVLVRRVIVHAVAALAPTVATDEIRGDATFIQKQRERLSAEAARLEIGDQSTRATVMSDEP